MVTSAYTPREVIGKPSTDRVKKLYDEVITSTQYVDYQRMQLYTEYMKQHWAEPLYTRRGGAFKYVLSNLTPVIIDGELIVGRMSPYTRGTQLYPENESQWMRETLEGIQRAEEVYAKGVVPADREEKGRVSIYKINEEDRAKIAKALEFYQEDWRTVSERILKERDDFDLVENWQRELVFYRLWWDVPEGRAIVNYGDVIDGGLETIIARCKKKIAGLKSVETKEKIDKYDFYRGTILALEGAIAFAENYAREAERLAKKADGQRKEELLDIARICRKVPRRRADTFREAVQSFWFTHLMLWLEQNARGISPGRFDQYMYRPFKDDIECGRTTEAEALELLELLRIKHTEIVRAHSKFMESNVAGSTYQHVTLGGVDKDGRGADNELSILVLQAGINVRSPQPTLSVLWCDEISHDFKLKTVECIKAGSGYPALFNNKVGIERFTKITGTTLEEARGWAPCACIDVQLPGKRTPSWVVSHVNMLKLLEMVLNDGVNPATGTRLVEDTGIKNIEEASLEEIKASFVKLMALVLKKQAEYWNIAMVVKNKMGLALPFTSALLDDCIERGLHCQEGGCRYNDGAYLMTCGLVNVANSLAAMKKCIFEEKLFTMKELREALKHNFEGYEEIRRQLLKAPKYGNADSYVDDILVELDHSFVEKVEENPNWLGEPWRASALSVTTEVVYGNTCGATPDGRKAKEQVADGSVSAYPGTDQNGPTALMMSAARPNHVEMDANLLNMKFHPSAIEGPVGSEKFIALNDAYFDLGEFMGPYHVQYNIVDSKMLRDAQAHPDKYQDLMIRVAGFTVRWAEIGKLLQDSVIRRTEHEEV